MCRPVAPQGRRYEPRGGAVRSMRLRQVEELADGGTVVKTLSAFGFIVRLATVEGEKPSDTRRRFARYCKSSGIVVTPVEFSEVNFSKRTGNAHGDTCEVASAYQVMGEVDALLALVDETFVGEFHAALNVRPPMNAQGSGPEKVRPPMGSTFGKPEQVAATATKLARQGDAVRTSDRKAWGEF